MTTSTTRTERCPGHRRHWFVLYGEPGSRVPVCVRCGADNPKPLKDDEWTGLEGMLDSGWPVGNKVEGAIRERRGEEWPRR